MSFWDSAVAAAAYEMNGTSQNVAIGATRTASSSHAGPMMAWTSQMSIMFSTAFVAVLGSQRESYQTHSSTVSGSTFYAKIAIR
eukprot:scaffold600_cov279-Pinguiococcus_pyrenoidosus.AAC.8